MTCLHHWFHHWFHHWAAIIRFMTPGTGPKAKSGSPTQARAPGRAKISREIINFPGDFSDRWRLKLPGRCEPSWRWRVVLFKDIKACAGYIDEPLLAESQLESLSLNVQILFDFLLQIYRRSSCFQYQTAVIAWSISLALPAITKSAWLVEICGRTSRIGVTSEISSTTYAIGVNRERNIMSSCFNTKNPEFWLSNKAPRPTILRKHKRMIHDVSQPSKNTWDCLKIGYPYNGWSSCFPGTWQSTGASSVSGQAHSQDV